MRCTGLLLLATGAAGQCPASGDPLQTPGDHHGHLSGFDESGENRDYHVMVPSTYDNTKPTTLLFVWSGLNAPCLNIYDIIKPAVQARGWIMVSPCGTSGSMGTGFNAGTCCGFGKNSKQDDFAFAKALIAKLESKLCIDVSRVFTSGFSNGAMMSEDLACLMPDTFRAAASVSGVVALRPGNAGALSACDDAIKGANGTKRAAVLNVHGTLDPMVPYATGDPVIGFSPIPKDMEAWATRLNCGDGAETFHNGKFNNTLWKGCDGDAQVELVRNVGGTHEWPRTADFNTTTYVLDFFDRFPSQ